MEEIAIGKVEKYFGKIGVAAVRMTNGELRVGDTIKIKGHVTDFQQTVESMQVQHESVQTARAGDEVGVRVKEKAHENDMVYLIKE